MSDDWDRDLPKPEDLGSQILVLQLKFQQFEPLLILTLNNSQAQRIFAPTTVCGSQLIPMAGFYDDVVDGTFGTLT